MKPHNEENQNRVALTDLERIAELQALNQTLLKTVALLNETQHITRVGGWEYDLERKTIFWTKEVYNIYEVPPDFNPNNVDQVIAYFDEPHRMLLTKAFERAVSYGEPYDLELPFTTEKGRKRWIRTVGRAEKRADTVIRVFGNIMDISDRKKMEAEREQFYKFFRTSADLMVIADPNGAFMKTNPACTEILGYSESELVAKPFIDFVHPGDKQSTLDEMARQMQKGFSLNFENRYICKDGSFRWLSWRAIFNKDEGITYATARDFTDRKQAEEELEKIFILSADLICIADIHGCFKKINPAWEKTFGYTKGELLSQPFMSFVHPDDVESTLAVVNQKLAQGITVFDFENRYRHKDGSYRWLSWTSNPVPEKGITYAIARDVTERKMVEQQITQSLREKETLLREIHHRVKNNMAVVSGLLAMQAKRINDTTLRNLFEESQQRVKSMILVHEKLYQTKDLSSINFEDYIRSIVSDIISVYRVDTRSVTTKINIENIELDLESAIPCGLIINELLSNVFKYAFVGNRTGVLSINFSRSDDTYTLIIKDNGVGLPEGFDNNETSTLGLQLVTVLTKQLRGTLRINSDQGTEVIITFKNKRK
ncbi:MAG: PAS domain S-box protein [Candidatus Riflebacteria bacterium]|nr:PAS domain S-box protein [Candidatus Riflebacteria bacterium]